MILRGGTCWEGGFGGAGSGKWLMTMIVVHCICEWSSPRRGGGKEEKGSLIWQSWNLSTFHIPTWLCLLFYVETLSPSSCKCILNFVCIFSEEWICPSCFSLLPHWRELCQLELSGPRWPAHFAQKPWSAPEESKFTEEWGGVFAARKPAQAWTRVHDRKCKQRSKAAEMASRSEQCGNQWMTR